MKVLINEKLSEHKYKTPEGYLICVDAVLARTGKQSYRRSEIFDTDDETEIEVDRTPEEVFSEATLASFENKPITVEHPDEDVNSGNFKDYSVGFVRDVHKGKVDGQDVILGTLVIQDAQTIEEIENGEHTDLSCGYDCDIIDDNHPQQRNIRGNHVALCECGRAGNARIVDSKMKDSRYFMATFSDNQNDEYSIFIKADDEYEAEKKARERASIMKDKFIRIKEGNYSEYLMFKRRGLTIDSIKDEIYSLQELREMRIDSYRGIDLYKIHGQYSTNPNTSNRRFNTLEQVKEYIDNGFRDSMKDDYFGKPGRRFTIGETVKFHEYGFNSWVEATVKAVKGDKLDLRTKYGFNEVDVPSEYVEKLGENSKKDSIKDAYGEWICSNWPTDSTDRRQLDNKLRYLGLWKDLRGDKAIIKGGVENIKKFMTWLGLYSSRFNEIKTIDSVNASEEEIKEYMKKTGFSYIDAKRALEEDNLDFVEKMRRSQYDAGNSQEEMAKNKLRQLKSQLETLEREIDRNDDNPRYDLDTASKELRKIEEEIAELKKKWGYILDSCRDNKPVIEAKGIWEYDVVKEDWYDTGRKMYYEEIKKQHLMDEETPYEEVTKSLEKNVKDSYIIQSKYNTENYLQEDNHFGMNKKFAQKFNSYEEAAKKANILYSDWDKHINIIKDSIKDDIFIGKNKNQIIQILNEWSNNAKESLDIILPGGKFIRIQKDKMNNLFSAWTSKLEKKTFKSAGKAVDYIVLLGLDNLIQDSKPSFSKLIKLAKIAKDSIKRR